MILHKLILHHLKRSNDAAFYRFQADDAIRWLQRCGVPLGPGSTALDLGSGHGIFGGQLSALGCQVTFADEQNLLLPEFAQHPFHPVNLDRDNLASLGQFDLVVCSNVLEHLAHPERFLANAPRLIKPCGHLFLSWTNWLSPWGGHEFSPFHYLGPKLGPACYDRLRRRTRIHTPGLNLFPTYISHVLRFIRRDSEFRIVQAAPRYYTEFSWIVRIPFLRELLTWNCALLLQRDPARGSPPQ